MRARYPDTEGFLQRNGTRIFFEVYENEGPTILLGQTWQILHSRHWKMQIPYLSRHFRVVTFDPVGNGRSDRSEDPSRFRGVEVMEDAIAVLDASGTESCVAAGLSYGGGIAVALAAFHPNRIDGVVAIAPSHAWGPPHPDRAGAFEKMFDEIAEPQGWEQYNVHLWRKDWPTFVDFFFRQCASDPHSTKLFEDLRGWALDTTGDVLAAEATKTPSLDVAELERRVREMSVPCLIIQGTDDRLLPHDSSRVLQEMIPGSELVLLEGAGHIPIGRFPVRVNLLIREFMERVYRAPAIRT